MRKLYWFATILATLLTTGCAVRHSYVAPHAEFDLYDRIAVLPLEDRYFFTGKGMPVADSLYHRLATSPFELVDWSHTLEVVTQGNWIPQQQRDTRAVVDLGQQLQASAILTGSIDEWRNKYLSSSSSTTRVLSSTHNYVSIVGLTLCLIDCRCGHVVWTESRRGSAMGRGKQNLAANRALDQLVESLVDNF